MILTVTLNAAVDRTYRVEDFALDRVHRCSEWRVAAGGKGINVARVYQTLGGDAVATGFLGGYNGRVIASALRGEGLRSSFVRTAEESRVCIAAVDPVTGSQTEINEVGPNVTSGEIASLRIRVQRLIARERFDFLALSGSIPPGVPDTIYADLIGIGRRAGVRTVLDASGAALRAGFAAGPWMVKPNAFELAMLIGREAGGDEGAAEAARSLLGTDTEVVCVTQGRDGCVCAFPGETWKARPPEIAFVSAVGSGDSFLGAFLRTIGAGGARESAVRLGVGAGAANAEVFGSGFCSRGEIERLAALVEMNRLDNGKEDSGV